MRGYRSLVVGVVVALLVVAVGLTLTGCGGDGGSNNDNTPPASSDGSSADTGTTDPGPGANGGSTDGSADAQRLVEVKCSQCHSLDRVWAAKKSRDEWVTTVDRMKRNGLIVTDEEYTTIIDHLASLSE